MRYDIETLPISEKTREGLSSDNINTLGAIGRMLSLQDDVYEERFEKLNRVLINQADFTNQIILEVKEIRKDNQLLADAIISLKDDVSHLANKINNLDIKITEINKTVDCTRIEVDELKKDVYILKKHDTWYSHAIRIAAGIGIGLILVIQIHQIWLHR